MGEHLKRMSKIPELSEASLNSFVGALLPDLNSKMYLDQRETPNNGIKYKLVNAKPDPCFKSFSNGCTMCRSIFLVSCPCKWP